MAVLGIRKYVNDFQPGKQGYEYTGEWVRLPADEREVRRWIRKCMAELVLMSLLFLLYKFNLSFIFSIATFIKRIFFVSLIGFMGGIFII